MDVRDTERSSSSALPRRTDKPSHCLNRARFTPGARMSNDGVRNAYNRYERLASTDALTGLANRRRFDEMLETEWNRARPLSVRPSDGAAELLTPADRQTTRPYAAIPGHSRHRERAVDGGGFRFGHRSRVILQPLRERRIGQANKRYRALGPLGRFIRSTTQANSVNVRATLRSGNREPHLDGP